MKTTLGLEKEGEGLTELGVGSGAGKQDSRNKPLGTGEISLLYITSGVWSMCGKLHRLTPSSCCAFNVCLHNDVQRPPDYELALLTSYSGEENQERT